MANVAHSTLTSSNLHENKGVATATDDFVATATSGATVWKKLTASNLTGTGNSFGGSLLHVQDRRASGAGTSSLTGSTWNVRVLNTTQTNEISGASLASNQITLPAGTYWIDSGVFAYSNSGGLGTKQRLRNITAGTTSVVGMSTNVDTSGAFTNMTGRFTLAGSTVLEVQQYATAGGGGGVVVSSGEEEIFVDVKIWKVA